MDGECLGVGDDGPPDIGIEGGGERVHVLGSESTL